MRAIKKIISSILLLALISPFVINYLLRSKFNFLISSTLNKIPVSQVALVLGASAGKKPSGILLERLDKAIELYRNQKVEKILFSGDNSTLYYDEVNVMKNYALKNNVSAEDIFLDHAGLRTLDSIYRAKSIFKIETITLVTQRYHLTRAIFLAEHIGLKAFGYVADSGRVNITIVMKTREFFAMVLALLDVFILDKKSEYKGKEISIEQDGRISWDKLD